MEGKNYTFKEYKERNSINKKFNSISEYNLNKNKDNLEEEILNEEYEKYKNYLMIKKECPACHFIQGLIFSGIGFFCFARMHHFRSTFVRNDFLKLFLIATPSFGLGIYKFTYANYIFGVKSKMDQFNKFLDK